jgi:hypothetical protein
VANQTLGGADLANEVQRQIAAGADTPRLRFHVVVPATVPEAQLERTDGDARAIAGKRLQDAMTRFRAMGADVSGEVGAEDPMQAIRNALSGGYDAIIISTLPAGVSRWLHMDLPHRVEREFDLPVITLENRDGGITPPQS